MRTQKIYALYNLIDWLNNKNPNINIIKQELDNSSLTSNSWLAGIIESEAHFSVRASLNSRYMKLECKMELCQRQNDHNGRNNLKFLEPIADIFLTTIKSIRMDTKYLQYKLITTSLKGNIMVENYLNNFPLFWTKYLD